MLSTELKQCTDIPIYFKVEDCNYKFEPKDDLTPIELSKVVNVLLAGIIGQDIDNKYYLEQNNLFRHFIKLED